MQNHLSGTVIMLIPVAKRSSLSRRVSTSLNVLNEPGMHRSSAHIWVSTIDITLAFRGILTLIRKWCVVKGWIISDHKAMTCVASNMN